MSHENTQLSEGAIVNRVPVAKVLVHDPGAPGHGYVRPGERLSDQVGDLDELIRWGSAELVPADQARTPSGEPLQWRVKATVEKYEDRKIGDSEARAAHPLIAPDETVEGAGNLLTIGGASALWERLIGTGITAFDNTNAYLGVGDNSGTAAADTQTDLQASSNKTRKAMDATYPTHTDSTGTAGSKTITYKSTFGTSDANYAWNEWGLFNASTSGRMLNRKVESLGTKTSSATWVLTITLSLA